MILLIMTKSYESNIDTKSLIGIMQQIDSGYKEYNGTYCDHRGKGCKAYLVKRIDIVREELLNLKKYYKNKGSDANELYRQRTRNMQRRKNGM